MLAELSRRARPSESIKQLVTHLLEIAAEQDACRKACSMYSICSVIREYFLHLRWTAEHADDADIQADAALEWPACVEAAVVRLREGLLRQYRERDVFDAAQAALCEHAARRMLEDLPRQGARRFFEYFREQFPDTTYEQYRANGRARFEYIMHCAKEQFFAVCRERIGE